MANITKGVAPPAGEMDDFKRPNHPDFMNTAELVKAKWSGFRHNSITDEAEFWILGEIVKKVTKAQVQLNSLAINEAYSEVFALGDVVPDSPEMRAYRLAIGKP